MRRMTFKVVLELPEETERVLVEDVEQAIVEHVFCGFTTAWKRIDVELQWSELVPEPAS